MNPINKPKVGDLIRMKRAVGEYIFTGQVATVRRIEGAAYYVEPLDKTGLARGAYWPQVLVSASPFFADFDIVSSDPVAAAEAELAAAQAKLEAAREAARKEEAEAQKIKIEDIKAGAVFVSGSGAPRMVVGEDYYGFVIVCPEDGFEYADSGEKRSAEETVKYMHHYDYAKTDKTLKDFI